MNPQLRSALDVMNADRSSRKRGFEYLQLSRLERQGNLPEAHFAGSTIRARLYTLSVRSAVKLPLRQ